MSAKDFNKTVGKPKKAKPRMNKFLKWGIIGVSTVVLLIVGMFFFPRFGTVNYGICRTFIEMQEPYPQSIQWVHGQEDTYSNSVKIFYKKVDPFGLEAMNEMVCTFEKDQEGNLLLKKVDLNGKKRIYPMESEENVKNFNTGIQGVIANPPSLIMPYKSDADIKTYR